MSYIRYIGKNLCSANPFEFEFKGERMTDMPFIFKQDEKENVYKLFKDGSQMTFFVPFLPDHIDNKIWRVLTIEQVEGWIDESTWRYMVEKKQFFGPSVLGGTTWGQMYCLKHNTILDTTHFLYQSGKQIYTKGWPAVSIDTYIKEDQWKLISKQEIDKWLDEFNCQYIIHKNGFFPIGLSDYRVQRCIKYNTATGKRVFIDQNGKEYTDEPVAGPEQIKMALGEGTYKLISKKEIDQWLEGVNIMTTTFCVKVNKNTFPIYIGIFKQKGFATNWIGLDYPSTHPEIFLFVDKNNKKTTWDSTTGSRFIYRGNDQLGDILQILNEPIGPALPKIHGYDMSYIKGDYHVKFGCASIAIQMIRDVIKIYDGRHITSIILDSGKAISDEQIKSILEYVDYINGDVITGTTPPEISCNQVAEPQDIHNITKMYIPESGDVTAIQNAKEGLGVGYRFLSHGEILIKEDQYRISGPYACWSNTNMIGKPVGYTNNDGSTKFIYRRKIS